MNDEYRPGASERSAPSDASEGPHQPKSPRPRPAELALQTEELQRYHHRLIRLYRDYQLLFEQAPVALLTLDQRGAVVRMNDRARSLLGDIEPLEQFEDRADDESQGVVQSMLRRLGPDQPFAKFDARLRGSKRRRLETSIVARHLDREPGEPEEILLGIEDRTAYRQTQRALVRSERELRSLLDLAPDGMCIVQENRYAYVNEAWATLLGRPRARLADETVFEHIVEADRDAVRALVGQSGRSAAPATVRLRSVDGSERTVELRAMQTEYRDSAAIFMVARDLTERRRLEARMTQSERLATIGLLVAGVAHEINNPLTFVEANLDELENRLGELQSPEAEELEGILAETRGGTARVARIISDLRTFQRTDDEPRPIDANRVLVETVRIVGPKIQHRARLERELGRVIPVLCNEGRLIQVLANLITNAADAMPGDRPAYDNRITARTWLVEGYVCIAIEDNGSGIPREHLEQIFDPFFTTRKVAGGTGLGLAISNSVVQQMGGFIAVDSEVRRGSRFVVHLPTDPAEALRGGEATPTPKPAPDDSVPPERGVRVLLVDDEELTLRALSRAIKRMAETVTASSGRAAIEVLEQDSAFDVVVTDLIMDDGSGRELIEWIATHHPHLRRRVILMTGMTHPELDAPDDIPRLGKPFDLNTFRELVREIAGRD